jgi:membrane-associated phospholipid phosphatase
MSPPAGAVAADPIRGVRRFGVRVVVSGLAVVLGAVPFTILGVAVHTQGTAANRLDLSVASSLHRLVIGSPALAQTLRVISNVFAPNVFRAVLVVGALSLIRRAPRLAIWIAVTVAGEAALDITMKTVFARVRPTFPDPVMHAAGGSYPSGHAFGSFVGSAVIVLVVLPLLSRRARTAVIAAAVLVVLGVGFARVGLGVHYVTDVLGGWLIGAAWVALSAAAFQSWRDDVGLRPAHPASTGVEPELRRELHSDSAK